MVLFHMGMHCHFFLSNEYCSGHFGYIGTAGHSWINISGLSYQKASFHCLEGRVLLCLRCSLVTYMFKCAFSTCIAN